MLHFSVNKILKFAPLSVILYLLSLLGVTLSYSSYYFHKSLFYSCLGFCVGLDLTVIALASIIHKLQPKRYVLMFLQFIILLFPFIVYITHIYIHKIHKAGLKTDDLLAIVQTNFSEIKQYMANDLSHFIGIGIFIFLISLIIISVIRSNGHKISLGRQFLLFCIGSILIITTNFSYFFSPFAQTIKIVRELHQWEENLTELNKQFSQHIPVKKNNEIIVVVIGESQNRLHMSAYGYSKNTTPWLSASLAHNTKGRVILFDNAYSCHTHTIQTLTYALTEKNSYNNKELKNCLPIVDVAKNLGGYKTWWISNQKKIGIYSSGISFLAKNSDYSVWTNESLYKRDPYDEIILPHLPSQKDLETGSHLVFIHLMGNHLLYRERYPRKWNKFGTKLIETYDNSILYNDHIVQNIYNHFSKMKNFSALIYFADHADSPENGRFHDSAVFSWQMTRIPFWIFFSNEYIENHFDIFKTLEKNQNRAFSNDLIFDTLMGILNIKDTPIYIPENDFSSIKYKYDESNLLTLHGKKSIKDDPKNSDRFWLHRVNSPQKMKELGGKYKGMELDIIYYEEENDFENSHDATDLKKFPLTETLKAYSKLAYKPALWFDFKNLTQENVNKARNRLENILKKYGINKKNIWIEGSDPDALEVLTKSGWNTSYYMPYYNLGSLPADEIRRIKKNLQQISFSKKVNAISFAGQYYSFVKSANLKPTISLLVWFNLLDREEFIKNDFNKKILADEQIEVILIKDFGHYHR